MTSVSEAPKPVTRPASSSEIKQAQSTHCLAPLRRFTDARIALSRSGDSQTTADLLDVNVAHALARDAVHASFDRAGIVEQLQASGLNGIGIHSAALDRATYLRRPDLGRRLDEASRKLLREARSASLETVFVIADGLSAVASERYAVAVLKTICKLADDTFHRTIYLAEQARVALGDELGELLGAEMVVVLIGERPGLSSPDSLGIYLTYAPQIERNDADRNCISNVRADGMSPEQAAAKLHYLMNEARRLKLSGVQLKDQSGPGQLISDASEPRTAKQLPLE